MEVRAIEKEEARRRAVAILAALEAQPGGATEYARRHAKLTSGQQPVRTDGGVGPWTLAARREALRG